MAVDRQAWYVLNFPWVEDSVELGSTGEIHSFGDWVNELLTTADALDAVMTYFDGSTPERPQWFSVTPSPGIVTAWGPVGNIRTGWVQPMADDYPASFITNDSTVPGAYVDDALDYLLANLGGGSWIDSVDELASAPPVGPPTDYRVMVNSNTPTGLFAGHPWEIAITADGGLTWSFVTTGVADAVISKTDPDIIYIHDGSQFQSYPLSTVTTFLALTDTPNTYVGQALKLVRVNAGETALEFVTDDYTVKASAADTTPDHLMDKLDAGSGVSLSIVNPGANEKVRIDVPSAGTGASITSISLHKNLSTGVTVPTDGSWIDVPFPTAVMTTGLVSKDGTNKIFTINEVGSWFVQAKVTILSGASGVGQVRHKVRIMVDTGSGYTELSASDTFTYSPNDYYDEATCVSGVIPFIASATDTLKVQVSTDGGTIAAQLADFATSVLIYKIEASSGGASTLAALTDVDIPAPTNGQVLAYNTGTSKWEAVAPAGGGDMLGSNNLSDVANANTSLNNILPSQAANSGKFLTTDGTDTSWAAITGTGDVVGPASSADGNIPQFDGTTGKLLKDGLSTSTGGSGATDDGKVAIYGPQGQLHGSSTVGFGYAVQATATGFGQAGYFTAVDGKGIDVSSVNGRAASFDTNDEISVAVTNDSATLPTIDVAQGGAGPVAHLDGPTGGLHIGNDGGASWTSATGAQTTATNLPAFGALAKGVVPAAGAVPSASKFLTETGVFAVPPDTTGITQLTGDVTAGPGSGSQAATIANDAVTNAKLANIAKNTIKGRITAGTGDPEDLTANDASSLLDTATDPFVRTSAVPVTGITQLTGDATAGPGTGSQAITFATVNAGVGSFGSATKSIVATFNAKGLVTSVSESTITPAVGSITGFGTGVATALAVNTGSAGAIVLLNGAGGTPSSLVLTNATGLPIAGITGLGTNVSTALAIAVGSAGAFVTFNGAGGTPSSLTLTNATGLPISTGLTGLGTGVATALAIAIGSAGAVVTNGGALGTPSSGTLTNATGLPISTGVSGLGTGVATALATFSSANIATACTDEMGTGKLAFGVSGTEAAYTGTITWTAGAAPSGTANLRQFYTQIGNLVTWQISLTYATTGTTITNVSLTFPTEFPTPAIPTGFTGASVRLYGCYVMRLLASPSGTPTNAGNFYVMRNSGDTGFEISSTATFTSGSYRTFIFSGSYFTS